MTRAREKLYRCPVGSEPVPNELGVSPGVVVRIAGGATVLCLPGMPREMRAALETAVAMIDEHWPRNHLIRRDVETPIADESVLGPLLEQLAEEFGALWVSSRAVVGRSGPKVYVTVEATAPTEEQAEASVDAAVQRLLALVSGAR